MCSLFRENGVGGCLRACVLRSGKVVAYALLDEEA